LLDALDELDEFQLSADLPNDWPAPEAKAPAAFELSIA
jgi:hypothetical protein